MSDVGSVTDVRLLQRENPDLPIDVTESGIVIFSKLLQDQKAWFPIDVTEPGMSTETREVDRKA